jgi:hypothetical protein
VEVRGGKEHAARHSAPGLWSLLDSLQRTHWPTMLRGDCAYGQEKLLSEVEARGLPCLFKLRRTARVKAPVSRAQYENAKWRGAGDGWEVMDCTLKLSGWVAPHATSGGWDLNSSRKKRLSVPPTSVDYDALTHHDRIILTHPSSRTTR